LLTSTGNAPASTKRIGRLLRGVETWVEAPRQPDSRYMVDTNVMEAVFHAR
jgi:hypothetical protein